MRLYLHVSLLTIALIEFFLDFNLTEHWLRYLIQTINDDYGGDGMSLRLIAQMIRNLGFHDYYTIFKCESSMELFRKVLKDLWAKV